MAPPISTSSPFAKRPRALAPYDHDELVREFAGILSTGAFGTVRARTGPYDRPIPIRPVEATITGPAYVPDVTASSGAGELDVFAVETPETLFKAQTARAWRAFASRARRYGRNAFWVVVREPLREAARKRLDELHMQAWVLAL